MNVRISSVGVTLSGWCHLELACPERSRRKGLLCGWCHPELVEGLQRRPSLKHWLRHCHGELVEPQPDKLLIYEMSSNLFLWGQARIEAGTFRPR